MWNVLVQIVSWTELRRLTQLRPIVRVYLTPRKSGILLLLALGSGTEL